MMTKEDIIRMAKEAGFDALLPNEEILGRGRIYTGSDDEISDELERFAHPSATQDRLQLIGALTEALHKVVRDGGNE